MTAQNTPRVGQPIGRVENQGNGLVALMNLWMQQTLKFLGRNPTTTVAAQVVGVSPYLYTNSGDFDMTAVVTGGTVSAVAFTRDGTNFYTVATATNASVTLNPGDSVRITYSVLPTLNLIPR